MDGLPSESMLLDVFGRTMQAMKVDARWSLFMVGGDGKKRLAQDVTVPRDL